MEILVFDPINIVNVARLVDALGFNGYSFCVNSCITRFDKVNSTDTLGRLRVTRTGSKVQGFFASGSSTIQPIGSPFTFGTEDVKVRIFVVANQTGSVVDGAFDNFMITANTVMCPPTANAGLNQTVHV